MLHLHVYFRTSLWAVRWCSRSSLRSVKVSEHISHGIYGFLGFGCILCRVFSEITIPEAFKLVRDISMSCVAATSGGIYSANWFKFQRILVFVLNIQQIIQHEMKQRIRISNFSYPKIFRWMNVLDMTYQVILPGNVLKKLYYYKDLTNSLLKLKHSKLNPAWNRKYEANIYLPAVFTSKLHSTVYWAHVFSEMFLETYNLVTLDIKSGAICQKAKFNFCSDH